MLFSLPLFFSVTSNEGNGLFILIFLFCPNIDKIFNKVYLEIWETVDSCVLKYQRCKISDKALLTIFQSKHNNWKAKMHTIKGSHILIFIILPLTLHTTYVYVYVMTHACGSWTRRTHVACLSINSRALNLLNA